jgi:hypothetical protein
MTKGRLPITQKARRKLRYSKVVNQLTVSVFAQDCSRKTHDFLVQFPFSNKKCKKTGIDR